MGNPFTLSAELAGIDIYPEETIYHDEKIYTEVRGCDMWLVQGSEPNQFYVSNDRGLQLSPDQAEPADAVADLLELNPKLPRYA